METVATTAEPGIVALVWPGLFASRLEEFFSRQGLPVRIAYNASEARHYLHNHPRSMLLLDGDATRPVFQLLLTMEKTQGWSETPVVFITRPNQKLPESWLKKVPHSASVERPFGPRQLLEALGRLSPANASGLDALMEESGRNLRLVGSGTFDRASLGELVRTMRGSDGRYRFHLKSAQGEGMMEFVDGDLTDARLGDWNDTPAYNKLMDMPEGIYEIYYEPSLH